MALRCAQAHRARLAVRQTPRRATMKRQRDEDEDDEMRIQEMRRQHPGRYAEMDDDDIWASICQIAAKHANVSTERARADQIKTGGRRCSPWPKAQPASHPDQSARPPHRRRSPLASPA